VHQQLKPNADGGDCWCSICVALFTKEPDEFMVELCAQAASCKWIAKKQPLQTAFTKHVGWLNYFLREMDVDFWTTFINRWITINFPVTEGGTPTIIGLEHRAIFDGLGTEAQKKMTDKEHWAKKAVHVVCKWGENFGRPRCCAPFFNPSGSSIPMPFAFLAGSHSPVWF
jgi:hypothetical protein